MDQSQIISLKDVESSYKTRTNEQLYLKSINLNVNAGEVLGIIGRAGSGKSALLRCIALLERPLTGILAIDNKNLTFMASKELAAERRNIAYVSAKPNLLNSKNLFENISLPLKIQGLNHKEIIKLVEPAIHRVGLETKVYNNPNSLTQVQKIQTEIARGLVNNPKILLCDDIFTGLDQKSIETLSHIIRDLQKDLSMTILISTNDAELIKSLCQNVIVMQHGAIIEQCSVYDLFTRPTSEVARDFLRFATKYELPSSLRKKIIAEQTEDHHALVRICFGDCLAPEEILSNTIEAYELKMNIIQAHQEKINDRIINIMLIEIYGQHDIIALAVKFLNTNSLQSEIIGYVPNIS